MEQSIVKSTTGVVSNILSLAKLGDSKLLIDYDQDADVVYINFGKSQKADDSIQEDGIIQRKKNNKLIGLTILNASRFAK